ncbi:hypothetical protein [Arthrobacter sp. TE12232]
METTERLEISCGPEFVLDWLAVTLQGHLETKKRPATDIIAVGIGLPRKAGRGQGVDIVHTSFGRTSTR